MKSWHRPWLRGVAVFVTVFVMGLALVQSLSVAVPWWRGELEAGVWEWFWIGLLLVWAFVFIRYFSIFRPGCDACAVREPEKRFTDGDKERAR